MAAVISIYPYDPGTDVKHRRNVHGIKSYHFWPSQDEELLDHKKDVGFSIPDGQSPLELPPKTLSAFYFLIQLFVRYCLTCLKRVAVTVKIYSIPNNKGPGEKKLEKLAAGNYDHGWEDVEKLADCRDEGDEKISSTAVKPNLIELEVDQNEMREKSHNFGGYLDKFDFSKTPCSSTTFSTSIFEVKNDGLHNLIKDIRLEIRKHQSSMSNAFDESCGSIVACCDLVWSIPSKFRSYWTEIYVENEICSLMDWNNQKIYDLLFSNTFGLKRASRGGTMQKIGATDSKTDTFVGVYRHFYPELMDMANKQAAQDHESIWKFDAKSSNIRMNWPIIGDFSATTVVALNLIILKF